MSEFLQSTFLKKYFGNNSVFSCHSFLDLICLLFKRIKVDNYRYKIYIYSGEYVRKQFRPKTHSQSAANCSTFKIEQIHWLFAKKVKISAAICPAL